jgi:putative endopeptidase
MTRPLQALVAFGLVSSLVQLAHAADASDGGVRLNTFSANIADKQLDPCTDFYQYACSNWLSANPIPSDQAVWGTLSNLQIWNEAVLRETMEQAAVQDAQRTAGQQKIGDYWVACMDEAALDKAGLSSLKEDLARISALKGKAALAEVVAHLHLSVPGSTRGFNEYDNYSPAALFGFGPTQDFADASLMVAAIDQGGMGLPARDYYLSDDTKMKAIRQKYLAHVQKLFQLSGESKAQAEQDAATVLRMETALARVAMDSVSRRDPKNLNNVRSLEQVLAATPSFDWNGYFKAISAPDTKHYLVATPGFLTGMEQLIKSEPLSSWKAYLRWWTLHGNAPLLSKAFVEENFDFYGRTLSGAPQMRPRWRRCVTFADRDLGYALGQAYVAKAFPPTSKEAVEAMVKNIEAALATDIEQLDWMSAATKQAAVTKLKAIEDKFGYPKYWRDYSSVVIDRTNLVKNVHHATAFEVHRELGKIGKPVDRIEWTMTPPTINAYYDPQLNTINFPAGILQPPLFDAKQDMAANYGGIGMVIGHEITHGFDDQGRKFDGQGNLRDWWTADDGKKYEEKGKCIATEYTQEVPDLGVKTNGLLTQGEDTADNGGIHIALIALEAAFKAQGKSLDTVGPDGVTGAQRFFLSFAFGWCGHLRPEIARTVILTNPHSLPKYRVNNVLVNMQDFQKAFSCKKGQPMVHDAVCKVW